MSNLDSNFQWQVESVRFTLFYAIIEQNYAVGLWQKITGFLPESRTERPQEGLLIEEGRWEDYILSISAVGDRIDIVVYSKPTMTPEFLNIGKLEVIKPIFSKLVDKLPFENAIRIAFSTVLLHPEANNLSGYQTLSNLLPNVKIEPDSQDFLYQVNAPKKSILDDSITINRLKNYSIVSIQFFSLFNNASNQNRQELVATRLELDVNTRQETRLSSSLDKSQLMRNLIDEVIIIAEG